MSSLTSGELIDLGMESLEGAEFTDALECFERAAVCDSANPRAWFYLGVCYLETGQVDNAVEALKRAISADSQFADGHYLLGTAMGASGDYDQAARCYRQALSIDPDHLKAEEFLIRTEALLASREHYRIAMRLIHVEPREPDWLNLAVRELLHSVAIFNDSPGKNEFRRLAAQIVESRSSRSTYHDPEVEGPFWARSIKQAESAFRFGNWPGAASSYHESLDLRPDTAFVYHALGLAYFSLGDDESGVRAWQQTLDIDADFDFSSYCLLSEL